MMAANLHFDFDQEMIDVEHRERQRGDMELFRHIDDLRTELRTYGLTELFLKSLSRLKKETFVFLTMFI